ncbi:MAG: FecR domain-containing protein, partial [Sulfuricaulis sp.]|nr:FecR domain-containing protein [Sulfuricaulis sp.]
FDRAMCPRNAAKIRYNKANNTIFGELVMSRSIRTLMFFGWMLFSLSAFAAALVETVTGDVKAGTTASTATAVRKDQRINPGSVVVTGPKSLTTLRFDDGQAIVLQENTEFRISAYSFVRNDPKKDSFVVDLLKGAMRSVSGLLGQRSSQAYAVRVPQATIGIRGTDFMVALVNPAYLSVLSGSIGVTNAAGTVAFAAGTTATVTSATALATSIAASALPASVATSFSQLSSIAVSAGAGATGAGAGAGGGAGAGAGAGAAVGAAAGGLTLGTIGIAAAVVGVAAVATSQDSSTPTPTSGTSVTTGTTSATGTQ